MSLLSLVYNFLVIPVVVSLRLYDVNDGSGGPKRVGILSLKIFVAFSKSSVLSLGVQADYFFSCFIDSIQHV